MFGKKLIVVAAAVALAMSHVAAVDQATHIKVHAASYKTQHQTIAHHKQAEVNATDAAPAPTPAAEDGDSDSAEDEEEEGEEDEEKDEMEEGDSGEGSPDVEIDIVIEGNSTSTTPETTEEEVSLCLPGWTEMSVEGVDGVYCVTGQACVADVKDGACPAKQDGLEYGSYCDKVETDVYGCKPYTKETAEEGEDEEAGEVDEEDHEESGEADEDDHEEEGPVDEYVCTGKDESPMSVEGVEGVYCVTGQACVADIKDGACPEAQEGLEYGAYCGTVKTGVYGCKPMTKEMYENEQVPEEEESAEVEELMGPGAPAPTPVCSGPGQSPMSVEGVEGVYCVTGQACVANIDGACPDKQEGLPYGSYCGTVASGVKGCKPNSSKHMMKKRAKALKNTVCSGPGQSPMSVEGVEGVYCVTGQACVADIKNGACPSQQAGLPWGAYCGKVKTGVYGCKPQTEAMWKAQHQSGSTGLCTGPGESPMSVEGVEGVYCVTGQACVANIDGACPAKQAGLPYGSYCGTVASGVKGCKPNSSKHIKGHTIKVTKVSAKKIHNKKH